MLSCPRWWDRSRCRLRGPYGARRGMLSVCLPGRLPRVFVRNCNIYVPYLVILTFFVHTAAVPPMLIVSHRSECNLFGYISTNLRTACCDELTPRISHTAARTTRVDDAPFVTRSRQLDLYHQDGHRARRCSMRGNSALPPSCECPDSDGTKLISVFVEVFRYSVTVAGCRRQIPSSPNHLRNL